MESSNLVTQISAQPLVYWQGSRGWKKKKTWVVPGDVRDVKGMQVQINGFARGLKVVYKDGVEGDSAESLRWACTGNSYLPGFGEKKQGRCVGAPGKAPPSPASPELTLGLPDSQASRGLTPPAPKVN